MAWITRSYTLDPSVWPGRLIDDDAGGIGLRAVIGMVRDIYDTSLWWAHPFDAESVVEAVHYGFRVVGGGANDRIRIRWTSAYDGLPIRVSFWLSPGGSEHPWYLMAPFQLLGSPHIDVPLGVDEGRFVLCSVRPDQPAPVNHWNHSLEAVSENSGADFVQHFIHDPGTAQIFIIEWGTPMNHWWAHPAFFKQYPPTAPWEVVGPFTLSGSGHDEFSTGVVGVRAIVGRAGPFFHDPSLSPNDKVLQSYNAEGSGSGAPWIRYGIRYNPPPTHDTLVVDYNPIRFPGDGTRHLLTGVLLS